MFYRPETPPIRAVSFYTVIGSNYLGRRNPETNGVTCMEKLVRRRPEGLLGSRGSNGPYRGTICGAKEDRNQGDEDKDKKEDKQMNQENIIRRMSSEQIATALHRLQREINSLLDAC